MSYDENRISDLIDGGLLQQEELLIPRYKVIAPWPLCPYSVGRILTPVKNSSILYDCVDAPASCKVSNPEIYTANLREMHWSEDRKPEDLPQYVKPVKAPDYVFKIVKDGKSKDRVYFENKNNGVSSQPWNAMLPATESEYNKYLSND